LPGWSRSVPDSARRDIEADVWGSDPEPYRAQVTFAGDRLDGATCTCPYDWGGWCKHIVAALLAARQNPGDVEKRQPLAELLAGLDRDQLQALLLKLADHEPGVVAMIEAQVPLLAPSSTPVDGPHAPQSQPPPPQVDPKALRRQVRSLLGISGGRRSWRSYANVGSAAAAVSETVSQAQKLVEAGDGRGALIMLDVITDEFLAVWEELDDSDGESIDFFGELGGIWAEALLTTDSNAQERRAWIPKLEAWQSELDDYGIDDAFEPALAAAAHGWEEPSLQRVLHGEITERGAWEDDPPAWADELATARLNVLERQGRHQEYLYLAEAEGQTDRYVTMLARLGRGAEALAFGRAHLTTAQEAFDLATALWERGEVERSLESAELGLTLEGPKGALASWLRDRAAEQGQTDRALAAARIAFDAELSLATYLKIQELAGPDWPAQRSASLDRLRKVRSYYPQGPVEIFLHEGLIEDAIAAVDQGATHTLVEQVAEAAINSHPDWVIAASRRQAEGIVDDGKSQYYGAAARWLGKARAAYQANGREQEWQSYLAGLLDRHRRKYTLVPLLKALR
jgi:uncharacterized Zn finger protein